MELVKQIVRVGNSAGVILPKEWQGGKARIELIKKPLNIQEDIWQLLKPYLQNILGVYLVGSYAREEQNKESDIDVLVITDKIDKKVEKNQYNLILISKENLERALTKNILPLLPMLKEAKPLLNNYLIKEYTKTPLTKENLKWHIETTKSAMSVIKEMINMDKETKTMSDSVAYSLVLRLREAYIVDCLIKNKKQTNKELINLIKKIAGSLKSYQGYLRVKNNKKIKQELLINEAEQLYEYIIERIKQQEKWVRRRK